MISTSLLKVPSREKCISHLFLSFFLLFSLDNTCNTCYKGAVATREQKRFEEVTQLNIRNAPAELIRRAKVQAASEGISLRQFVLDAIGAAVEGGDLVEAAPVRLSPADAAARKR